MSASFRSLPPRVVNGIKINSQSILARQLRSLIAYQLPSPSPADLSHSFGSILVFHLVQLGVSFLSATWYWPFSEPAFCFIHENQLQPLFCHQLQSFLSDRPLPFIFFDSLSHPFLPDIDPSTTRVPIEWRSILFGHEYQVAIRGASSFSVFLFLQLFSLLLYMDCE